MRKISALLFLISLRSISLAAPITFYDVNWSMTVEQITSTIASKGFRCQRVGLSDIECIRKLADNTDPINDAIVYIVSNEHLNKRNRWISFNCEAYNGCEYSKDEMNHEITKRYKIQPKIDWSNTNGNLIWIGTEGDKLTLVDLKERYHSPHQIILFEGILGKRLDF